MKMIKEKGHITEGKRPGRDLVRDETIKRVDRIKKIRFSKELLRESEKRQLPQEKRMYLRDQLVLRAP